MAGTHRKEVADLPKAVAAFFAAEDWAVSAIEDAPVAAVRGGYRGDSGEWTLDEMMASFDEINDDWRATYLMNEGSSYYVREADYQDWLVLTGQKKAEAKGPQVTADQIPTYDNAGDPEASGVVTAKQIADFMLDFEPYSPGWLSIQIMGNYSSVKEDDYNKWLALTGKK